MFIQFAIGELLRPGKAGRSGFFDKVLDLSALSTGKGLWLWYSFILKPPNQFARSFRGFLMSRRGAGGGIHIADCPRSLF